MRHHLLNPVAGTSPLSFAQASYPSGYFPSKYCIVSMQLVVILSIAVSTRGTMESTYIFLHREFPGYMDEEFMSKRLYAREHYSHDSTL